MNFEETVIERNLNKWNVLIASILAGFSRWGVLSQGIVNKVMEVVGDKLSRCFKIKNKTPDVSADESFGTNLENIIEFLNRELELAGKSSIELENGQLVYKVISKSCNFCPIGVGEAELDGTACPYPSLIKQIANHFLPPGQKVKLVAQGRNYLSKDKEEGACKIIFENDPA